MFLNCRLFLNDVHLAWLMSCTAQGLNEPRRKDTKFRALATDGSAVLHQLEGKICSDYKLQIHVADKTRETFQETEWHVPSAVQELDEKTGLPDEHSGRKDGLFQEKLRGISKKKLS
ncbi:predicted protein [Histoplasma capsulatum G186AR]|uniref:Uncharacterized protein n=1 Tax=Ajellomyces capsulatus (strain G186AR / H82 / ATCC MYA-2454 / RMSCC 2432) TaxID=447093 RepID=C0P0X1_AJECG|nr:uncharacterized protein HCBG_09051 [Histoplasma capsulatum G186AR]EEH02771.1 predicted protein [Histoplasma capsulatum G186AR]